MDVETLYSTLYKPDPARALDVLAFVLSPTEAFSEGDPEIHGFVLEAKREAAENWQRLQRAGKQWC